MEPKIVERSAFTVAGLKYHGNNKNNEIPQLWGQFGQRAGDIKNVVNPHVAYGVMGNFDEESQEFDYIAGMEVEEGADVPQGMAHWHVPSQTYAVFTGTLPNLMETYKYIYETWLPQSGHRHTNGPEFEFYDKTFDPEDPASELEIYIPIN